MELAKRKDVPVELTWNLADLYTDEAALRADMEDIRRRAQEMEIAYKGKLDNVENTQACLNDYRALLGIVELAGNYCNLAANADFSDPTLQERDEEMSRLAADTFSRLSFITSEISEQDEATLRAAIEQGGPNQPFLTDILREKPYRTRACGAQPGFQRAVSNL